MASISTSSAALSSSTRTAPRRVSWGRYVLVALGTIVVAVLANLLVYYLGSLVVSYNPEFVVLATNGGTIFFTVIPAIVATLLYAILLRFAANPVRVFVIVSAIVLIASIIPDFTYIPGVPGASNGQTAILILMHFVAAAVIVGMLTTLARPQTR